MSPIQVQRLSFARRKTTVLSWAGYILSGSVNAVRLLIQLSLKVEAFSQTNFPMG
jgi:hypothetical protein